MNSKFLITALSIVTLVGCTTAVPTADEVPASIGNATTTEDHEKIAVYYDKKAQSYDTEAAWHERMAKIYSGRPKGDMGSMISHCRSLRDQFLAAAKTARTLAHEHRSVAKGA